MNQSYNHREIEKKWQEIWEKERVFCADNNSKKQKKYVLDMFPYPSAAGLHVGHPEGYTATDIYSRYLRMNGYEVIHPIGWDAFGLPAENYAIKIGVHPKKSTTDNIKNFIKQIKSFGFSYDWEREINTSDPNYYKWSQWFFLLLYKNGLAYKKKAPVNWCQSCNTVLANEQVQDGKCERCKNEVVQKDLEQWFFKVTKYAEELLTDMEKLDWPEALKTMQRNWIGKSDGAEIDFDLNIDSGIKELFLASNNESKKKRIEKLLKHLNINCKVYSPKDLSIVIDDVKENKDLASNAKEKALAYKDKVSMPIIGIDTGLFIDGESIDPVKVKRNALVGFDEKKLDQKEIYKKMVSYYKSIAKENNGSIDAYFLDAAFIVMPDGSSSSFEIKREIILTDEERSTDDIYFPINSLYKLKKCNKYYKEISDEEEIDWLSGWVDELKNIFKKQIKVFTTRPDTLYGATYMVLAPEHKLVQELKDKIQNFDDVKKYIISTSKKSNLERTDLNKNKTGVELLGIKAINPVNKYEIPIYISDYVLSSYGTGAIMCVPAHDQRDFEFAEKFNLPVIDVVKSNRKKKVLILHGTSGSSKKNWYLWLKKKLEKIGYDVIVPDMPDSDKPVIKKWVDTLKSLVSDFTSDDILIGHSMGAPILMHLITQTNLKIDKLFLVAPATEFMSEEKIKNSGAFSDDNIEFGRECLSDKIDYKKVQSNVFRIYAYFSDNDPYIELSEKEGLEKVLKADYKIFENYGHFSESTNVKEFPEIISDIESRVRATEANGVMQNSGEFDGMNSDDAKAKITQKANGKFTVQYKIRDWLVSRQRYWGAPIPIIYCDKCGMVEVSEDDLPVLLPDDVTDFRPTGKSPLATSKEFNENVKCPKCGSNAKRELDTMDGFVDNSWYYYRYLDPKNEQEFCSRKNIDKWMPVDTYVGGAEHAVGHLIYSRFFTKVLRDTGYLDFDEPFLKLINQGLILGADGQKMSKSLGNVINPDEVINEFGADSFRLYEMFMGPLEDPKPWNTDGIRGQRRFLDKNWQYLLSFKYGNDTHEKVESLLHKTIKKIGEDIESFKFNTAISSLMIYFKELSTLKNPKKELVDSYLIMLSCFAPHISEEIWKILKNKGFICSQAWPKYDKKLIIENTVNIPVQINGKLRANIEVVLDIEEEELKNIVLQIENVKKNLENKKIVKFIFIKNKIVNIVVN